VQQLDSEVVVEARGTAIRGTLTLPRQVHGLAIFAHGSGSSRHSPRNRFVAEQLNAAGLATLLLDLLSPE
jgi:putative phosphoribosyl transferase